MALRLINLCIYVIRLQIQLQYVLRASCFEFCGVRMLYSRERQGQVDGVGRLGRKVAGERRKEKGEGEVLVV